MPTLRPALIEWLKLNDKRIESMAVGVEQIANQVDPVGQTIEGFVRPNGLRIDSRRVPLGVVLFFYRIPSQRHFVMRLTFWQLRVEMLSSYRWWKKAF